MNNKLNKIEYMIGNLNGYLQSMRRLCLNQCHYTASVKEIKQSFEDEIESFKQIFDETYQVKEEKHFTYKQIQQLHKDLIYSKLKITDKKIIELFEWDIVEYFGLTSTSVGGEWNPLVKNGAFVITIQADKFKSLVYYFVVIESFMIIITLSENEE